MQRDTVRGRANPHRVVLRQGRDGRAILSAPSCSSPRRTFRRGYPLSSRRVCVMNRLCCVSAVTAMLAATALTLSLSGADQPSIKEIMNKAHRKGDSLLGTIEDDLKQAQPNWDEVQADTKELVSLGAALGKATPRKGGKASWEQLTAAYLDTVKALDAAAQSKDKTAAVAAQQKLSHSCMSCHR